MISQYLICLARFCSITPKQIKEKKENQTNLQLLERKKKKNSSSEISYIKVGKNTYIFFLSPFILFYVLHLIS
jgi:hypothetical protein